MTDFTFSKTNIHDFSTDIKNLIKEKKFKKIKNFIINLPVDYKEIVTQLSENIESCGFTGSTKFQVNSITSRLKLNNKHNFILSVNSKLKVPDVIAVK